MAERRIDVQDQNARATAVDVAPERVDHGDPRDVAGLYVRHRSSFTAQARRALRDQRDVDEVVQEAFLRMFLALPELETESQAVAYGRRTITNLCIDRYRAQARRPALVDLDSIAPEDAVEDDPGDPVVRAEDAAVVRQALGMLPPLHRQALVKREIEEKPLPVIADELGIPEDSVKHLLYRSRRALRRLLVGTSVAPGADGDGARRTAPRIGSRGVATVLALLLLGLGSGPDLEAVPVVGVDLPDLLGVTEVARTVGDMVTDVVDAVTPGGTTDPTGAGRAVDVPVDRSGAAGSAPAAGAEAEAGGLQAGAAGPAALPGTSAGGTAAGGPPARDAADGRVADGRVAEGGVAERRAADGRVADGRVAEGGVAERRAADGRVAEGRVPPGRVADVAAGGGKERATRAGVAAGDVDVPRGAARPQPASPAEQRGGRPQDRGKSAAAPAGSQPGIAAGPRGAGKGRAGAARPAVPAAVPRGPAAPAARGPERAAAVSGGAAAAGGRAGARGPADRSVEASDAAPGRGHGRHGERAAARAAGADPSVVVPPAIVPPPVPAAPVAPAVVAPAPAVVAPVVPAPVVLDPVAPAPLVPDVTEPVAP